MRVADVLLKESAIEGKTANVNDANGAKQDVTPNQPSIQRPSGSIGLTGEEGGRPSGPRGPNVGGPPQGAL